MIHFIAVYSRCLSGNPSFFSGAWSHFSTAATDDAKHLSPLQDRPRLRPEIQTPSSSCSCSDSTHLTPHPSTPQPSGRTSSLQRCFVAPSTPTSRLTMKTDVQASHLLPELLRKHFLSAQLMTVDINCEVLNVSESDATSSHITAFNLTLIDFSPAAIHPVQHPQSHNRW